MDAAILRACTPVEVGLRDGQPWVRWMYLQDVRFTDPFFGMTVRRALQDNPRRFQTLTPWEALAAAAPAGVEPPAGFIFHTSRCGSSLVSRCLADQADTAVLAEPTPLGNLLYLGGDRTLQVERLRQLVGALPHSASPRHVLIKWMSWNLLHLDLIREAFPSVPYVFVYRHPLEVLVSVLRSPPRWLQLREGTLVAADMARMTVEEQYVHLLATFYHAVLARPHEHRLLVNYSQLPDAIWESIAGFLGVDVFAPDAMRMRELSRYHAKDVAAGEIFQADSASKRAAASVADKRLVDEVLLPLYRRLESERLGAVSSAAPFQTPT